jgi:hypothetical protein
MVSLFASGGRGKGKGKPFEKGFPFPLPPDPHPLSLPKLFMPLRGVGVEKNCPMKHDINKMSENHRAQTAPPKA